MTTYQILSIMTFNMSHRHAFWKLNDKTLERGGWDLYVLEGEGWPCLRRFSLDVYALAVFSISCFGGMQG